MGNSHENENESIYVCDDDASESGSHLNHAPSIDDVNRSPVHNDAVANIDTLERSSASVVGATCNVAIEDELAGVSEVRNVPVTKLRSDQARPVVKNNAVPSGIYPLVAYSGSYVFTGCSPDSFLYLYPKTGYLRFSRYESTFNTEQ